MYVCLSHDNDTFEHVYYFLFNDVLLLFEDKSIRLKTMGKQSGAELLKIIPISSLHSYSIPENQGLVNSCQIVFYPIDERVRQCFTILFPSSEDKESFSGQLESCYNQITRYHISYPLVTSLSFLPIIYHYQNFVIFEKIRIRLILGLIIRK